MTMREFWANVYPGYEGAPPMGSVTHAGQHHDSRESTEMCAGDDAVYRIHVRLKPEGAPKRYLDDAERYAWEWAARRGEKPRYS